MQKFKAIPFPIRLALVKGIPPTREEILFRTLHNNKCLTLDSLFEKLSLREGFGEIYKTKSSLKKNLLDPLMVDGSIKRGRAVEMPKFHNSGYAVDIFKAYRNRLPYTLMELDPLPGILREDYIYHLFFNKDVQEIYSIFPEKLHEELDKFGERYYYYIEKFGKQLADVFNEALVENGLFIEYQENQHQIKGKDFYNIDITDVVEPLKKRENEYREEIDQLHSKLAKKNKLSSYY